MTIRDTHPLPRMIECIDLLRNTTFSSTVDCSSGLRQNEVHKADRNETTFSTHHGLFRFTWVPFGLKTAPALLPRPVETTLSRANWYFASVYLKDIIVYSAFATEHLVPARALPTLLQNAEV